MLFFCPAASGSARFSPTQCLHVRLQEEASCEKGENNDPDFLGSLHKS